jgi:hypothetical protein
MEETVIALKDRRMRMLNVQEWAGQGAAALALLTAGVDGLMGRSHAPAWLWAADLAVGVFLLAAIGRELKAARRARGAPHHHAENGGVGLGWVSLLGGAACFLEWGARALGGGKLFTPVLLTGVVNAAQGLMAPYFERRRNAKRSLHLSDAGVDIRLSAVQRFQAPWSQLASVVGDARGLLLTARDGRTCRLRARRYDNFAQVADAIAAHAAAHHVAVRGHTPAPAGAANPAALP